MATAPVRITRAGRRGVRLPTSRALLVVISLATAGCAKVDADPAAPARAVDQAPSAATSAAAPPSRCAGVRCASIERCDEASGRCVPDCPAGEVYIPPTGPEGFVMGKGFTERGHRRMIGKGHRVDSDRPHRVVLTRPFCMDEAEVTVRAMKACVDEGRCDPPKSAEIRANYPKKPDHPVNEVSWTKAKKFCEAYGKRLPTEAQWEWAATGGDGRKWPWGDEPPTCEHADFTIGLLVSPGGDSGCHGGGTSPVKAHPRGVKVWPSGALHDLAGNVWEWCEDSYAAYPAEDTVDPLVSHAGTINHVVRGGGWNRSVLGIQTAFRGAAVVTYEVPGLGFRCVRSPSG